MSRLREDLIRLTGRTIEVAIDPALGAEIVDIRRPGGGNVLASYDWESPSSTRDTGSTGESELDWLSDYRGGWQELFPNASVACVVDGVPLPFHGEASRSRWEVVAQDDDRLVVRTAARLPLVLERTMWLTDDPSALRIEEVVRSDAPVPTAFLLGHHPAFLATAGARVDMPGSASVTIDRDYMTDLVDLEPGATGTWPTVAGRDGSEIRLDEVGGGPVQRLAYLADLGPTPFAAIRGVHPGLGAAMAWDPGTFGCIWYWWEIGGPEHPWYGRARIVAIEPATAFPADGLAAARERGVAHELPAGGAHRAWLTLTLFASDERPVRGVDREGHVRR